MLCISSYVNSYNLHVSRFLPKDVVKLIIVVLKQIGIVCYFISATYVFIYLAYKNVLCQKDYHEAHICEYLFIFEITNQFLGRSIFSNSSLLSPFESK
jgi:hypothetical protein